MNEITCNELGPAKVLHLYSPRIPLRAVVVVDNIALGPAIGGVRVSPTVTTEEVMRLARTMTLKNSIAGLPHGGAKAGIIADPKQVDMERLFRGFARMIRGLTEYIPGPDMGCDETCMAWIRDVTGRSCGLPEEIGGLPLDRLGATGFGLASCATVAAPRAGFDLRGARVAIQGFGSVGTAAARFLQEKGAIVVAASDTGGTIHHPDGIDAHELANIKKESGSVCNSPRGRRLGSDDIFGIDCDILIPAATPDVINEENAADIRTRLVLQGANIAVTAGAEDILARRGILSIPDFIANAGGVIMAAMEYAGKNSEEAFAAIDSRIVKNTRQILDKAGSEGILPRPAGAALARERVLHAMEYQEV